MSKRALKTYISKLPKKALEEQILELYEKFPAVKTYYDFAFNPKEDKLIQDAKAKIANEYFPLKRKRPKARRSVAQKFLKHFIKLGVDPHLVADVMCYNLEIALTFSMDKNVPDSFFRSMLNSFNELIQYTSVQGILPEFKERILKIYTDTQKQRWLFDDEFSKGLDIIDLD
ncbi:DUF6155 family protein [Maribacter hydrothermalis]|uniref:Uncharacterized protein n=1 Tax=Maribacter hydrothermalis TaxID=1836467 RepID=A0A1B7Z8M4_9FLAO|nr:DUF6155 family protein [Maribacter hydrothermalis]APQ18945.1 hypothetical protein BTR34_17170 [Maribacter hydrothermalis]OBR39042.1 hypothetical protein A9200_05105 [Maribacter hydrothermalis]